MFTVSTNLIKWLGQLDLKCKHYEGTVLHNMKVILCEHMPVNIHLIILNELLIFAIEISENNYACKLFLC